MNHTICSNDVGFGWDHLGLVDIEIRGLVDIEIVTSV